jgi:hypothetical protein
MDIKDQPKDIPKRLSGPWHIPRHNWNSRIAIFLLILSVSLGCARAKSNLTSVRLSSAVGPYQRIAVGVAGGDLTIRAKIEHEFADQLARDGVQCFPISDIIFAEKISDTNKLKEAVLSRGAKAVLFVSLSASGEKQVYVPPEGGSYSYGYANLYQGQAQGFGTSHYRGGYFRSIPWLRYNLILTDTFKDQTIWTGISVTAGKSHANIDDFIKAGVTEAVKKLEDDGVIGTR